MVSNGSLDCFRNACQQALEEPIYQEIQDNLSGIRSVFQNKEIRLKHPREIIPLHESIINVTKRLIQVGDTQSKYLSSLWLKTLTDLNRKTILRVGIGRVKFDCSAAIKIIQANALPKISIEELDLGDRVSFEKTMKAMVQAEEEVFGTFLSESLNGTLLAKPESRCLVAKDQEGSILGFVWGFNLSVQGKKVFHTFRLARKIEMAKLGIANLLAKEGLMKMSTKSLDGITLNVDKGNCKAIELYKKLGFQTELSDEQMKKIPDNVKVFMFKYLKNSQSFLTQQSTHLAMTSFIIRSIGLFRLAIYELVRRLNLLWRKVFYLF